MRIALSATALLSPLTGLGQYTYHLAKGLQATPALELDLFYGTGWSKDLRNKPSPSIATIKSLVKRFVPNPYSISRFMQQRRFNGGVRTNQADIYHEPNFLPQPFDGNTAEGEPTAGLNKSRSVRAGFAPHGSTRSGCRRSRQLQRSP